jgi:NAD(P)H-hydrate epimerase
VLTRAEMRAFDAYLIATCGVPGIVLMENAGRGAADVIERDVLRAPERMVTLVVVCGAGNNGGDGFVVARHLKARGHDLRVFLASDPARLKGDAKTAYDAWIGVGGEVKSFTDPKHRYEFDALVRHVVVVDALFGTGLDRAIDGDLAAIVKQMNDNERAIVALDIPSGLDADTGETLGASVRATHTVTFAHHQQGLLTPKGAAACGRLHVADLGVSSNVGPAVAARAELLEREDVARLLPPRALAGHKNSFGHVVAFAGSGGTLGAALMVSHAALRAGAGVVTVASWEDAASSLRSRVTEAMVTSLDHADVTGSVDRALHGKQAIVVGPGFGTDAAARAAVTHILSTWDGPAIYDADALTLFTGNAAALAAAKTPCVLTPHAGEAARLLGTNAAAVEADRYTAARTLAARARAVVVLKGAHTLIADPDGRVVVSPAASPVLATAGSGDTLSGITGAMLAALPAFDAACAAVFIHAAAAEAWGAAHGDRGLLASEIADGVPDVLRALTGEHTRGPR